MNDICLSIYWSFSLDWVFLEIRSSPVLHLSTVAASPRTPLVESLVQFTVQGALRPLPQQIFARNCKVNIGISMPWFTKPCPSADWWRSQDFHSLIHCKVLSHSLSCPSLRVPGTYTVTLVTICWTELNLISLNLPKFVRKEPGFICVAKVLNMTLKGQAIRDWDPFGKTEST